MNLTVLLDMVVEGMPDRVVAGTSAEGLTASQLRRLALSGADLVGRSGARTLVYLGGNGLTFPVALFAAAYAGMPFLPVNYRLSDDQLEGVLARQDGPLVLTDTPQRLGRRLTFTLDDFMARAEAGAPGEPDVADLDGEAIAVLLMTSGTTATPKSAVLRHRHLTSYILSSVEFMSAEESDATIVSVPPYHIAAVANLLSNLFAGRRIVYLDRFTAAEWLDQVASQGVTNAMVVPTMLVRVVEELKAGGRPAPTTLRSISYGGAKVSTPVLVDALRLFPGAGFVNAYGLTETASSIAVLGPEDHRDALASDDPQIRARLGSVGRALPGVEIEIHDAAGRAQPPGEVGDIVVRGPQVAGEYLGLATNVDADGWFPTRDVGYIDADGFIFVQGRSDDTIIRGGENIAPSEIEAVLAEHEDVRECAVAGVPDEEWGQRIVAFVVPRSGVDASPQAMRAFVRERLRSSKTPDEIVVLAELPVTATGKILRRALVDLVVATADTTSG